MLIYDVWLNDQRLEVEPQQKKKLCIYQQLLLERTFSSEGLKQKQKKADWPEGEKKYIECVKEVIASCVFNIFVLWIWLLESVFKQMNNLFLLPHCVPDLDKKSFFLISPAPSYF